MAAINQKRTNLNSGTSAVDQRFRRFAPLLAGLLLSACSSGLHGKVETLSQKEARLRASVTVLLTQQDQIRAQLESAQNQHSKLQIRINQAEADGVYLQCLADRAHFDATRQRMYAEQMRTATEYSACASKFAKSKAEFSALGCLLSVALFRGFGGLAACGGVVAVSDSMVSTCGPRPQPRSSDGIDVTVGTELGFATMPVCVHPDSPRSR